MWFMRENHKSKRWLARWSSLHSPVRLAVLVLRSLSACSQEEGRQRMTSGARPSGAAAP